jgi:hypothetical protein
MATSNPAFEWLRAELTSIRATDFHRFEALPPGALMYEVGGAAQPLAGPFADFLAEFGQASLFNGWGNMADIVLLIYPLKAFRREVLSDGRAFVAFADRGSQHLFFDEQAVRRGESSPVYVLSKSEAKELHLGFESWLEDAYQWARKKFSQRQWTQVLSGAPPFSESEQEIIDARDHFHWRHVGFAPDGDALFEVENASALALPYLSIGIKDKDGEILVGGAWLKVGHIQPGSKAVVQANCYKDQIPPNKLVAFALPAPLPERREDYWEFVKAV